MFTLIGLALLISQGSIQAECGQTANNDLPSQSVISIVGVITPTTEEFVLPDGEYLNGADDLEDRLFDLLQASDINLAIDLDLTILTPSTEIGTAKCQQTSYEWKFNISHYHVRISWERHYVACFKRNIWHLGFNINDRSIGREVFNLHLGSWWDSGGPQFGAYNSAKGGICAVTKLNYNAVWTAIRNTAQNASMTSLAASVVATATSGLVLGLLAQ